MIACVTAQFGELRIGVQLTLRKAAFQRTGDRVEGTVAIACEFANHGDADQHLGRKRLGSRNPFELRQRVARLPHLGEIGGTARAQIRIGGLCGDLLIHQLNRVLIGLRGLAARPGRPAIRVAEIRPDEIVVGVQADGLLECIRGFGVAALREADIREIREGRAGRIDLQRPLHVDAASSWRCAM